jgi:hypothetical protein
MNAERWRNTVTGRRYLLIKEVDGACFLEGIDRRVIEVRRDVLDASDVWEKING